MSYLSLQYEGNPLASPAEQLKILEDNDTHQPFAWALDQCGLYPLQAMQIDVLQVNVGRLCNQRCAHCHVDAGPDRKEVMTRETMQACIDVLAENLIPTLDITGGAPEMNPDFRWLVEQARGLSRHVIDRCNLTVFDVTGYEDLPGFLASHWVEVIASLPCYEEENFDAQRGCGSFERALRGLRRLNVLGYGQPDSGLILNLVHNPLGSELPPDEEELEEDFHRELESRFGVVFNRLMTVTNMPISRFLDYLVRNDRYDQYMETLVRAFNPDAAKGVMCRTVLSVDWTGRMYDCDFNQVLQLGLELGIPWNIRDFDLERLASRRIAIGQHCYGCAAGAGSSCHGAITRSRRAAAEEPATN